MCDPASIVGGVSAVASLAGSAMQASAKNAQEYEVVRAREAALRNTINKQEAIQREAAQVFQPIADEQGGTADAAQRAAAAQEREAAYSSGAARVPAAASAVPAAATGAGVPQVVTGELNRKLARASREGDATAGRRADLDAYSDVVRDRSLNTSLARGKLGMLSDFSQGEGALLPGRLNSDEANIRNRGTPIFGDLLQGAGTLGAMYGFTRPKGWTPFGDNPYTAQPGAGLAWRYDK
jgi:hypothetical protein